MKSIPVTIALAGAFMWYFIGARKPVTRYVLLEPAQITVTKTPRSF